MLSQDAPLTLKLFSTDKVEAWADQSEPTSARQLLHSAAASAERARSRRRMNDQKGGQVKCTCFQVENFVPND